MDDASDSGGLAIAGGGSLNASSRWERLWVGAFGGMSVEEAGVGGRVSQAMAFRIGGTCR